LKRILSSNRFDEVGAPPMIRARDGVIWVTLAVAILVPIVAAVRSPLLAWRDPVYIVGGVAGVVALALLLLQPLLAAGYLPGLSRPGRRYLHRWIGGGLVVAVVIHVGALWITSPPDVLDALLFVSPAPFSFWGVMAMWALFAAAILAAVRHQLRLRLLTWRRLHTALAAVVVTGSVVHAMLIEGTMEWMSKAALCVLVIVATAKALVDLRIWAKRVPMNKV
jgi:predicted ferric reductase